VLVLLTCLACSEGGQREDAAGAGSPTSAGQGGAHAGVGGAISGAGGTGSLTSTGTNRDAGSTAAGRGEDAGSGGADAGGGTGADAAAGAPGMRCEGAGCYWTRQLGSDRDDAALRTALDAQGNVYVTGYAYQGFDGHAGEGASDAFLLKLDAEGETLWSRMIGSAEDDGGTGVAVDGNGDVYVTGSAGASIDGQAHLGQQDFFVAKYNGAGEKLWLRLIGSAEIDAPNAVAVDSRGGVYVMGTTVGSLDGTANAGLTDYALVKLDSAGTLQWTRQLGTDRSDSASGVAVSPDGDAYVLGWSDGNLEGGAPPDLARLVVIKYSPAGDRVWLRQLGPFYVYTSPGIALDGHGNVLVSGSTGAMIGDQPNLGEADAFVAKYDAMGTLLWTRQMGTPEMDVAYGIATDAQGAVYVTGYTEGLLAGNSVIGIEDAFLIKLDGSGQRVWTQQFGTAGVEVGNDVEVDAFGDIYLAGQTRGDLDGNPNAGALDAFITKLDPNGKRL
jgi:hypothetical protein